MPPLPDGTVTFLFSDVEGSTQLLEHHGDAVGAALARHHEVFEALVSANGGHIFETVGDAVYAAFARPQDAALAAIEAHASMQSEDWNPIRRLAVRIAIHTGPVERRGNHYFGSVLFRAARLQSLGYGEQTLLSGVTARMVADVLPPGAALRDLGTHRLKDLGEPEHVFQLDHPSLRAEFPPPKSLDARRNNLPLQLSSFVGRERDLEAVGRLITEHRLVTVVGPGGVGKTRIALQVAADHIEHFTDGVFFVDLAALRDPDLLVPALAGTLGLREEPDRPLKETLATYLHDRSVLFVLDNLEQLLPSAGPLIAELAGATLDLHLLSTSRASLRIRGEQTHILAGLETGRSDRLDPEPPAAVALFLDRARAIGVDLELTPEVGPVVSAICSRLDGLPLAIELAAARLRIFSLTQLHDRLAKVLSLGSGASDLPERQQTLRGAIAWTEELLAPPERLAFARLGVFAGGFTLDAAEQVAAPHGEMAEILATLVDHSLVRRIDDGAGNARYGLLEMVREYAEERLEQTHEGTSARDRFVDHMLGLVEDAEPALVGDGQEGALVRLDAELANIRLALRLTRDERDSRFARIAASLARYWIARGLLSEGKGWVHEARITGFGGTPTESAHLLHSEGMLAGEQGALADAAELLVAAADLYRASGDRAGLTRTLVTLSHAHQAAGAHEPAIAAAEEAISVAHELGDLRSEASATGNLAVTALKQGRVADARIGIERAVEMLKRAGDRLGVVIGLGNLGTIAAQDGDIDAAIRFQEEALADAVALNSPDLEAWARSNLANAVYRRGDLAEAASLEADAIEQLARAEDTVAVVNAMAMAACILATSDDADGAITVWSTAENHAELLGILLEIGDVERSAMEAVRVAAPLETWESRSRDGTSMSLDEAVAFTAARLRVVSG